MTELSIASIFSSRVDMFECQNFAKGWTIVNLVFCVFVIFTFMLSRKRLAIPYILFRHTQILYTLCLVNQMKDDCLSRFIESYDSFFFFRFVRYFIGSEISKFKHNFLNIYNGYDDMLSNLFDMYFYTIIFTMIFVLVVITYVRLLVAKKSKSYLKWVKFFVDLFSYSVLIKFFELFYYPLCLIYVSGLYNLSELKAFDILVLFIIILITQAYIWSSLFVLNTYFNFFFKSIYIRKFGALYIHTYFFDLKKLNMMVETDTIDKYSRYRVFNLVRNHLILEKVGYFWMAAVLVYFQYTDSVVSYVLMMVWLIIIQSIFYGLRSKNEKFFYMPAYDALYTLSNVTLVVTLIVLIINSRVYSSIRFGSIFIMIINITLFMGLMLYYIHEVFTLQKTDLVWKLKIKKQDKINDREDYVNLLRAENLHNDLTASRSFKRFSVKSATLGRFIEPLERFSFKETNNNVFREPEQVTSINDIKKSDKDVTVVKDNLYNFIFEKYKVDK